MLDDIQPALELARDAMTATAGQAAHASGELGIGRTSDHFSLGEARSYDAGSAGGQRVLYLAAKRAFDIGMSLVLLLPLVLVALVLLMLNPWLNRGSLLFVQDRMGQHCRRFRAYKFRSMSDAGAIERGAFDALDTHRITPLGHTLRQTRLDELPQVLNVLRGEMSLIGPRPDFWDHAVVYLDTVPGYRERHTVKPGISGYAQTEVGYVDGLEGMHNKVAADLYYVRHANARLDSWIAFRTLAVVLGRHGA